MSFINDEWVPLIKAEQSLLINIFHCPEALFPSSIKKPQLHPAHFYHHVSGEGGKSIKNLGVGVITEGATIFCFMGT